MGLSGRYTVQPSPLDEDALQIELAEKNFIPRDYARTLAERKAQAMAVTMSDTGKATLITTLIIGSDTIVDLDGSISEFHFNAERDRSTLNYCCGQCTSHPVPARYPRSE